MKKLLVSLFSALLGLFVLAAPAYADSVSVNFEPSTYTVGNINGQDGWLKSGAYDVAVVANTYGFGTFGTQSLRSSDAVTSGSFGDQTFSKSLINEAGETDALNSGFSGGIRQNHFEAQFDLASTLITQQPGMHMSVSPDRGDGARMSYLRFEDGTSGINVFFDDVQGTSNPANFVETQVATGLSRSPHSIKFVMDFINGPSNDVVKIYIDAVLVHTGTSWENYYRFDPESNPSLISNSRTVDSLLFRESGAFNLDHLGNGFLVDNLSMSSTTLIGPPTNKDQCKKDGWKTFNNPVFRNQGDCVSFVEHKDRDDEDRRHNRHENNHENDEDIHGTHVDEQRESRFAFGQITMGSPSQRMKFLALDKGVSANDKGKVEYWNYDYPDLHYKADVLCANVKPTTKEAWFMFQIPAGWPGLTGLYVVSYVKDVGTPGTAGDLYGHTASGDLTTAQSWCENGTAPVGMYPITGGNLFVEAH